MKCIQCEARLLEGKLQCPQCRIWNVGIDAGEDIAWYKDVESAEEDRLCSGPWDAVWGPPESPGMVKSSLTFLAGRPGNGKSSLLIQIARAVQENFGPVLYIVKEENKEQVKARGVRFQLPPEARIALVSKVRTSIADLCKEVSPKLILLDSLPALVGLGWSDVREAENIMQSLKDYATAAKCPAIVIDHVNKKQEFSGPVSLEHLVDTTIDLVKDKKFPNIRRLVASKNRHGPAGAYVSFEMTAMGLVHLPNPPEEDDELENDEDE